MIERVEKFLWKIPARRGTGLRFLSGSYSITFRQGEIFEKAYDGSRTCSGSAHPAGAFHPEVAIRFVNNKAGKAARPAAEIKRSDLQHLRKRTAANILELDYERKRDRHPRLYRGNRSSHAATEILKIYLNGRYVKSAVISKAAEDAYKKIL